MLIHHPSANKYLAIIDGQLALIDKPATAATATWEVLDAPLPEPVPEPPPPPSEPPPPPPPSGREVRLFSTLSAKADNYPVKRAGQFVVMNNVWAAKNFKRGGWSQAVGVNEPSASGAIDARFRWNYPAGTYPGGEVLAFPEIVFGQAAGVAPVDGVRLPLQIGQLQVLEASYMGLQGSWEGLAHLSYDIWASRQPGNLAAGNRLAEIMLPEQSFPGGYGVPNWGASASGRTGGNGRDTRGYDGRRVIDGETYDVFYTPAGTRGWQWAFIVFQPLAPGGNVGKTRNLKALFDFIAARGWLPRTAFVSSVEFGVEPVVASGGGSSGDITVQGFNVRAT